MKSLEDFLSVDELAKKAFAQGVASAKMTDPTLDVGGPLDGWGLTVQDCVLFYRRFANILKSAEEPQNAVDRKIVLK